jgi:hypothetical protein
MATLMCLVMLVSVMGAAAGETVTQEATAAPELVVVGGLGASAIANAIANGERIEITANANYEGLEEGGDETLLLAQTLLSAILFTGKIQQGQESGLISCGVTAKDEELLNLDISYFGDLIYVSSDLLGEDTYKVSISEALEYLTRGEAGEGDETEEDIGSATESFTQGAQFGARMAELLSDPAVLEPYQQAILAWAETNLTSESQPLTAEEATELAHPEAVEKYSLTVSGLALQTLVNDLLSVLLADDNMLGAIAQYSGEYGEPMSVEELKEAVTQLQGMAGSILVGMLKSIEITALYDDQEELVYLDITSGLIVSEEQTALLNILYDKTVVDGIGYTLVAVGTDSGDGNTVEIYLAQSVEPIVETDGVYTQNQKTSLTIDITNDGETGAASLILDAAYNTGADKETINQVIEFALEGALADGVYGEGAPYTAMKVTSVETTDLTETGFITTINQAFEYLGEDTEGLPITVQTVTLSNAPGEELTEPADAINALTLTDEQLAELKLLIGERFEALGEKITGLYPELAEYEDEFETEYKKINDMIRGDKDGPQVVIVEDGKGGWSIVTAESGDDGQVILTIDKIDGGQVVVIVEDGEDGQAIVTVEGGETAYEKTAPAAAE